jgi:hypothetical protein
MSEAETLFAVLRQSTGHDVVASDLNTAEIAAFTAVALLLVATLVLLRR